LDHGRFLVQLGFGVALGGLEALIPHRLDHGTVEARGFFLNVRNLVAGIGDGRPPAAGALARLRLPLDNVGHEANQVAFQCTPFGTGQGFD
jgi:hypothetical protein